MHQKGLHIQFAQNLNIQLIAFCLLFSLSTFQTKAQDTSHNYKHNFGIFPVYEGLAFKYEHKLNTKRNKSFRYTLTLKGHDDNSKLFTVTEYNEQKLAFQFRNYPSKKKAFNGFYHGTCVQYKHFVGESISLRKGMSNSEIQALGLGYTIGLQRMTKNGFNFEFGWAFYYQMTKGRIYYNKNYWSTLIYPDIPYDPYYKYQSQFTFGIGMAIK